MDNKRNNVAITNDEWNALLIKIRQEFMLRNNFMNGPGTLQPMSAQLDSQNGHSGYMASGDKIRQSDIEKIFAIFDIKKCFDERNLLMLKIFKFC